LATFIFTRITLRREFCLKKIQTARAGKGPFFENSASVTVQGIASKLLRLRAKIDQKKKTVELTKPAAQYSRGSVGSTNLRLVVDRLIRAFIE
jgi:hypothetical protein